MSILIIGMVSIAAFIFGLALTRMTSRDLENEPVSSSEISEVSSQPEIATTDDAEDEDEEEEQ